MARIAMGSESPPTLQSESAAILAELDRALQILLDDIEGALVMPTRQDDDDGPGQGGAQRPHH